MAAAVEVLVVGAGAVGIGYGYHLFKGGAKITFFVRPKYVEALTTSPLVLHRLYFIASSERREFKEYSVISTEEEVKAKKYDVVIFTAPQNALRKEDFAKTFVSWLNPETTIMATSSGHGDWELFADEIKVSMDKFVYNQIAAILWQAPIPDERFTPVPPATGANKAIGYIVPSGLPFCGNRTRADVIIKLFNKGGISAHYDAQLRDKNDSALLPVILGLKAADWSFYEFRKNYAALVTAAIYEVAEIKAKLDGKTAPTSLKLLLGPYTLGFAAMFAPRILPFDIERYMKYHFATKIPEQVQHTTDVMIKEGKRLELSTAKLEELVSKIPHSKEESS